MAELRKKLTEEKDQAVKREVEEKQQKLREAEAY